MLRAFRSKAWLGLAFLVAGLFTPSASAQERGEEVVGTITAVDNLTLTVKREGASDVQVRVTPSTEVYFSDSGDRKLFPNPNVNDLRPGMGVRFVYGTGTLDRIVVHYVPSGGPPAKPTPEPRPTTEQIKARIQSINRGGRELRADVAGRTRTFRVESRETRGFAEGDLVVLTVENRGGDQVVTRIDPSELSGIVRSVDTRRRSITIEVNGRDETYTVRDRNLLDDVREGDRIRFEVEERSIGSRVITAINRRR